jgi:DNA repair protein RecO (recombination protein O)
MLKTLTGIVLKETDYSNSSKILTVFTKEEGKISVMYKSAKQYKKGAYATAQLFTIVEFVCYEGRKFYTHASSQLLKAYRGLKDSIVKLAAASYIAQVLLYSYEEKQPDERAFLLTAYCLNKIDKNNDAYAMGYTLLYLLKLLAITGYAPLLNRCIDCGKESSLQYFDTIQGGLVCRDCHTAGNHLHAIQPEDIHTVYYLLNVALNEENIEKTDGKRSIYLIKLFNECLEDKILKKIAAFDFLVTLTCGE